MLSVLRQTFIRQIKNIFYFVCVSVIFLTPMASLVKHETNIVDSSGSVYRTEKSSNSNIPVNPISSNNSQSDRESESESEKEVEGDMNEKFEKEIEIWSYIETNKSFYKLSYDLKLLDHIQKFTSDGTFIMKWGYPFLTAISGVQSIVLGTLLIVLESAIFFISYPLDDIIINSPSFTIIARLVIGKKAGISEAR